MNSPSLGFVGIGSMGWPMAARLAEAGFDLLVSDSDFERAARFAQRYSATAMAADELLPRCELLITMLPSSAVVEQVFGPDTPARLRSDTVSRRTVSDLGTVSRTFQPCQCLEPSSDSYSRWPASRFATNP